MPIYSKQPWNDLALPGLNEAAVKIDPFSMLRIVHLLPVQLCSLEGLDRGGVGNLRQFRRILEFGKLRKFRTAAVADRFGQFAAEIAEERERSRCAKLLTHEDHGDLRAQQVNRCDCAQSRLGCHTVDAIASRTIPDLIVVLNE